MRVCPSLILCPHWNNSPRPSLPAADNSSEISAMRVLVAFDKFKDALTATQACEAVAKILRTKHPDWLLDLCPLSDGGEGFTELLTSAGQGSLEFVKVSDARGHDCAASFGLVPATALPTSVQVQLGLSAGNHVAIVGMASASGLSQLAADERNPWQASSLGTGQLLALAAGRKPAALLLGLGGSATNDLGLGALSAWGFKFFAADGSEIASPIPASWEWITRIESTVLSLPPLFIACDVTNPLLGPTGATAIFGPQKGLPVADVPRLEVQLSRMATLLCEACDQPLTVTEEPGAGAAGGIGCGLRVATGANFISGFDLVSRWLELDERIAAADLILTGEGRFDATSLGGKGPGSLVLTAARQGKPAHVFAGSLGLPADHHFHAITPAGLPLAEALPRTVDFLTAAVARVL